MYFYNKKIF